MIILTDFHIFAGSSTTKQLIMVTMSYTPLILLVLFGYHFLMMVTTKQSYYKTLLMEYHIRMEESIQ